MTDSALLLSSGGSVFFVILPSSSSVVEGTRRPAWVEGSNLLVTGVFSGKVDTRETTRREGISQLESFQVLLRSPDDVVALEIPSWWTAQRALMVLGLVVILTMAVLVWVVVLRRRVEQQTLVIRRSEERFRQLAEHDSLTGMASRLSLHEHLNLALEWGRRNGTPFAILMMDIDNFKQVNDALGHSAGDEVLCIAAKRIQASIRNSDTVARMGGDEFLVLLRGMHDVNEIGKVAAKVVSNVSAPISIQGREVPVSVSIGICTYPEDGENSAALLHSGDVAMYRAKMFGRNCYQFSTPDMAQAGVDKT